MKTLLDTDKNIVRNVSKLFSSGAELEAADYRIGEKFRDVYLYKFNFGGRKSLTDDECKDAVVCQTTPDTDFKRNLGSISAGKGITFTYFGEKVLLEVQSSDSVCERNKQRMVKSKILMECSRSGADKIEFVYENHDCEYHFIYKTDQICDVYSAVSLTPDGQIDTRGGELCVGWIILTLLLIFCVIFIVWMNVAR